MWVRLELEGRRRLKVVLEAVGTAPVSIGLVVLALGYHGTAFAWASLGSREGAVALTGSWAFAALGVGVVVDALVALARGLPLREGAGGALQLERLRARELELLLLRAGQIALGAALLASYLSRDTFLLRLAEGEPYTAQLDQVAERDPPRPRSPGLATARFTLERIERPLTEGKLPEAEVRFEGGRRARLTSRSPVWLGPGSLMVVTGWGIAPRYEVLDEGGRVLESAWVKLGVARSGEWDGARLGALPHFAQVTVPENGFANAFRTGSAPPLEVRVWRGKLRVGGGVLRPGEALRVESLLLRFPEIRLWVGVRQVRDAGIPLAALAALLGASGCALRAYVGRRRRRALR